MPVSTLSELCSVQPSPQTTLPPQQQHNKLLPPNTPIIHPQGASTSSSVSSTSQLSSPASPILLQQSPPSPASVFSPASPAPVSDSSCPHCQELEYGGDQQRPVYWRIQLDRDLFETILAIYPEWFKDCNLDLLSMAEGSSGGEGGSGSSLPLSPPKAEVDDSPLQKCMDKNKESLKVKLMLRRPINQLVAQGIMPPLKTPPAFHEQRQKLERAKMGDLLKAKIQQRPDRQELVRQHILEDVGHVDPSLAERQRMLKKARLQDSLNDQLSHRPGPLELIKKNILHTDETIERAVKEGQIPFRATCEGQLTKPQHPNRYITYEEDSSSEGGHSPPQHSTLLQTPQGQLLLSTSTGTVCFEAGQSVMVPVSVVSCPPAPAPSPSVTSSTSSLSPISSVASPQSTTPSPALVAAPIITLPAPPPPPPPPLPATQPAVTATITVQHISTQPAPVVTLPTTTVTPAPTPVLTAVTIPTPRPISRAEKEQSLKNRKKSKTKSQPKTRTIKFHEYKGPPNAQKANNNSPPPVETSYELLLQQQQLFLQWQLEWQHKYPQIILPAAQKPSSSDSSNSTSLPSLIAVTTSPVMTQPSTPSPAPSQTQSQTITLAPAPSPAPSLASPAPPSTPQPVALVTTPSTPTGPATPAPAPTPETVMRTVSKLEDMKVSDLKAELKRRNLPVSGSKPQLIERLRPFSEQMGIQATSSQQVSTQQQLTQQTAQSSSQLQQQTQSLPSEQPSTPSSINSVQSYLEPRSVATLALGEDSLSGLSMDTPVSPMGDTGILSLDGCLSQDSSTSSSGGGSLNHSMSQPSSPLSLGPMSHPATSLLSPAAHMDVDIDMGAAMDTSAPDTPGSPPTLQPPSPVSPPSSPQILLPLVSEDIIVQQQRKIEQLQRELQKSQQQLQRIKGKEIVQVTTTPNQQSSSNSGDVSTKNHLQQHLQHKIQQQQLQEQLQQLQHLQSLQQQQQQQLVLRQQANNAQLQNQQGLSAKASLAAFLQQQQQQQTQTPQTVTPLVLSITTASAMPVQSLNNNNNNNNCSVSVAVNNKNTSKSQPRQPKLSLNQINLQKQKATNQPLNGFSNTHQRTASLPNFFGSFSQQQQQSQQQQVQIQVAPVVQQQTKTITSQNSEPNFLISKPPPLYEEAAKLLKVKQEPTMQAETKQKHIKSQIVDDVLEILIKNGELPPSAAQDPATPTTPGQSMPQGLVFKTSSQLAEIPAAETPPPPPPPPPPPLPQQQSFTLGLTSLLGETITLQSSKPHCSAIEESEVFTSQLDMILGQTGNNPQPMNLTPHTPTEMPSSTPAPTIDLKDLGLDLETLDTMDFSQLDSIKLEASDLLEEKPVQLDCRDQCEEEPMEGVVSAGDMPMDLDVSDWLESLLPSTSCPASPSHHHQLQQQHINIQQPIANTQISHFNTLNTMNMFGLPSSGSDLDSYDPLLCNSQDVFDLFNLEDTDLKMTPSDINNLNWDKVDFAT